MTESYTVTKLGQEIAQDVYNRFYLGSEPLEAIAETHGMEVAELQILMTMVFNGGTIEVDGD